MVLGSLAFNVCQLPFVFTAETQVDIVTWIYTTGSTQDGENGDGDTQHGRCNF